MKTCRVCLFQKEILYFQGNGKICRACKILKTKETIKKWRIANSESQKKYSIEYRRTNLETIKEREKSYRKTHAKRIRGRNKSYVQKNIVSIKLKRKLYAQNNKARRTFNQAKRRIAKLNRTPKWLSEFQLQEIKSFYEKAAELTEKTGIPHEVDHILPLQAKEVSGLHVPWNLQILTKSENSRKNNRVCLNF